MSPLPRMFCTGEEGADDTGSAPQRANQYPVCERPRTLRLPDCAAYRPARPVYPRSRRAMRQSVSSLQLTSLTLEFERRAEGRLQLPVARGTSTRASRRETGAKPSALSPPPACSTPAL